MGPSWQHIATKMGHDSAKLAILGSTCKVLGACWEQFAHGLDSRKPTKTNGKHSFFGILGCLKRWLKHFFGDVGSKMAFFGHLESTCGTCWRQDGQQDGQDGQHEGQDGRKLRPRWAKIAPSWRSWAQLGRFWEHVGSILGVFWHMGWMAENLQKLRENIGFWVFGGA